MADSGLLGLVLLLRVQGISASAEALLHGSGVSARELNSGQLVKAAKESGVKARLISLELTRLGQATLPIMTRLQDGTWLLIGQSSQKADELKFLVQDPREANPRILSVQELAALWTGETIVITKRAVGFGQIGRFDVRWFIPALLKYRRLFGEVLLGSFFLQLFGLVTPLFFQVVIDKVLVHRGLTTLDVLIIGLVIVNIFETILGALRTYIFSHTTNRVDVTLGAGLFKHLLALPLAYFGARRVGDSVARVRELENIRDFLTGSALTLVIDAVFTVVFLAVMYYYSPLLTWIVIASIPCFVALSLLVTPVLRARVEEKFARGAERQAFLVESITGVETLKAMAVEPQMQRRWEEQLAASVSASFRAANLNSTAGQVAQLISKITTALTLFFGAKLVIQGDLSVGQLVAFNMLAGRVSAPVLRLAQLWQDFQQARISIERLGDILNTPAEPTSSPSRAALPRIEGKVVFDRVQFRYRLDGQQVLKGVSLELPAGQVVGVVGPSGSGKSTLAKLMQRLYIPESGRVLIDGIDLAMVDPAWLRRQIGVVLQENLLFNRSIRENIALADPGMEMGRVIEAAKLAGAHEFILQLPEGYDTVVGERGASLSGGQRQRIAIARALVGNPRILIFDEATSALDYESEHAIQQNMRRICQGRTVIIIAHRLAAVRGCDRILTIESGLVVEDGAHLDLIRQNGRYASFYRHQSGEGGGVSKRLVHLSARLRARLQTGYKAWRTPDTARRRKHELEFLPAALELVETPPSPAGRLTLWAICAFLALAVLWASLAQIDIVATAEGKIVPSERVKVIQPVEIGKITAIHVTEGQTVKAGDVLVELDTGEAGADQERTQRDLEASELDVARLSAVTQGKTTLEAPKGATGPLIERQQAILDSVRLGHQSEMSSLDQEISQHQAEREGTLEQVKKLQQTLPLVRKQAEARSSLAKEGYGSKLTALQAQQQAIEQAQDLQIQQKKITELDATLNSLIQKRQQTESEFQSKQLSDLADAARKADEYRQDLAKATSRNDHMTLTAPVDGVVQQLAVHTVGGVVTPAQELMIIVPNASPLEIEASIQNKDIGFVRDGQDAEIKIETFPFTKYGLIHGKVLHVSHDAVAPQQDQKKTSDKQQQSNDEPQGLTYTARVSMERTTMNVDGELIHLTPGMAVTAEVKTGKRRVIEYLLSPLMRYKQESLRER